MNITNGTITFSDSDIAQLHPLTQAALAAIVGSLATTDAEGKVVPRPSAAEYLSTQVNACLESYAGQYREANVIALRPIGEAIATATPEQLAQIQPLMAQAQEILGI